MSRPVDTGTLGAGFTIFLIMAAIIAAFVGQQREERRREAAVARCAALRAVAIKYEDTWRCWQEVK